MKNVLTFITIAVTCLITACSTGRYLQFQHPASAIVGIQMTAPNTDTCRIMLAGIKNQPKAKDFSKYLSCSKTSASDVLSARATIRNIAYNYLIDIEAVSISECRDLVKAMMEGEHKENVEVVSKCVEK